MRSTRLAMLSAGFGALIVVTGALAAPTLVATVTLAHEGGPSAVLPSLNLIYVCEGSGNRISIINGATNSVTRVTTAPSGTLISAAANPTTNRVYVSQQFAKKLLVLDGPTGDAIEEILVPSVVQTIEDVTINAANNEIFVVRGNNGDIVVLDGNGLNPHATLRSFSHGYGVVPFVQLGLDAPSDKLYVGCPDSTLIKVFRASTGALLKTIAMPAIGGVNRTTNDLAVDPTLKRIYAANAATQTVTVLDGMADEIAATITVASARVIAANPNRGRAYATSGSSIVPIDGVALSALPAVAVSNPCEHIVANPQTGRLYPSCEIRVDVVNDTGIVFVIDDANQAPIANAGLDRTVECSSHSGTPVTLDGTGSSDPDPGTTLTYQWKNSAGTVVGTTPTVTITLPLGAQTFTLKVSDGSLESSDPVVVTVVDTTAPAITQPPDIQVGCSVNLLVPVTYSFTVTDACDPNPTVVASPASGSGFPIGTTKVTVTATDSKGNSSAKCFNVVRAALSFTGFLSPIGGADATGGSFSSPVKSFKLNSTIPVKFTATCDSQAVTTGAHTLSMAKYSDETTSGDPIDATPQDAATTGNQFKLTDDQWHFNLDAEGTGMSKGIWLLTATLSDGSKHTAWIQIK